MGKKRGRREEKEVEEGSVHLSAGKEEVGQVASGRRGVLGSWIVGQSIRFIEIIRIRLIRIIIIIMLIMLMVIMILWRWC